MHEDLRLALDLADLADGIALPRFRALDLDVRTKADRTPVTEADEAVERAIRERLGRERPGDAILGEEEGASGSEPQSPSRRRWIVDPIDGTRNYSRGIPVWFTLLGLERGRPLEVGVASAPALGRRWWARRGRRARSRTASRSTSPRSTRSRTPSSRSPRAAARGSSRSSGGPGTRRRSRTRGRTCSSPRARSTPRSSTRSGRGTSPRSSRSWRRPAAASPPSDGTPPLDGPGLVTTNGILHDAVLAEL